MADGKPEGSEFKVPFLFVKHGDPLPLEWMAAHPGWVKFPATLVPRPAPGARPGRAYPQVSGADQGTVESGTARPVSMGAPMVQRPGLRNRRRPPRFPGRFGGEEGQPLREDPVAAYLRVSKSLTAMGLMEPVDAWHGKAGREAQTSETAVTLARAPVPVTSPPDVKVGLHASAEGLAHDPAPAGSYQVAQDEEPPVEEERFVPGSGWVGAQAEANINMYYNAFRALRDIDPTNPVVTREVVVPQNWVPSDADVQDIQQALADARQSAANPEASLPDQRGSYSRNEYDALAADPSHGNAIGPKGRQERQVGLNAERQGLLPGPITRDPTGAAEFIDGAGQAWDVKGFNSNPLYRRGRFNVRRDADNVDKSLANKENVIIDTINMNQQDIDSLRSEGILRGWGNRVIWP